MIENVMNGIDGAALFGIISICMFLAFFTGMFFWAVRLKKHYLNSMGALPLNNETAPQPTIESRHE